MVPLAGSIFLLLLFYFPFVNEVVLFLSFISSFSAIHYALLPLALYIFPSPPSSDNNNNNNINDSSFISWFLFFTLNQKLLLFSI